LQILPKVGCHGNVPQRIGKRGPDRKNSRKYLSFGEKFVKVGPVDPEIIWLKFNKEEINASKIVLLANLPSGLNYLGSKLFDRFSHMDAQMCMMQLL